MKSWIFKISHYIFKIMNEKSHFHENRGIHIKDLFVKIQVKNENSRIGPRFSIFSWSGPVPGFEIFLGPGPS